MRIGLDWPVQTAGIFKQPFVSVGLFSTIDNFNTSDQDTGGEVARFFAHAFECCSIRFLAGIDVNSFSDSSGAAAVFDFLLATDDQFSKRLLYTQSKVASTGV